MAFSMGSGRSIRLLRHVAGATACRSACHRFMSSGFKQSHLKERGKQLTKDEWDVVIIGSGPVGCALAKTLVEGGESIGPNGEKIRITGGKKVLMVDAGQRLSNKIGEHVKNSIFYQADHAEGRRLFSKFIQANLVPYSVLWKPDSAGNADPITWQSGLNSRPDENGDPKVYRKNLQNPDQKEYFNLAGAAGSFKVGGQGTHWTAACPRPHPTMERNKFFPNDAMYEIAEKMLHVNQTSYDDEIRSHIIGEELKKSPNLQNLQKGFQVQPLPLAVRRINDQYVQWTGTAEVLGDKMATLSDPGSFDLADQMICREIKIEGGKGKFAVMSDPRNIYSTTGEVEIRAKHFVAACGQIGSAQLLAASGVKSEANGKYLAEQPMFFTRLGAKRQVYERLKGNMEADNPYYRFKDIIQDWRRKNKDDPVPIPRSGKGSGEIQQWIPVSKDRPWHCQIHNDNFDYGGTSMLSVDDRLLIELRWFTLPKQQKRNQVTFDTTHLNKFGLPQPTFKYSTDRAMRQTIHNTAVDLIETMNHLGSPLPEAATNIQFLPNGTTLHIHGCNRIGDDPDTSVADVDGRIHGHENVYVVGNGVIPRAIACNPTLTSVALAIRTAMSIFNLDTSGTRMKMRGTLEEVHPQVKENDSTF